MKSEKAAQRKKWRDANCWTPHQLRHTAATAIRREHGIEIASIILGHKSIPVSELYAEKNIKAAEQVMQAMG